MTAQHDKMIEIAEQIAWDNIKEKKLFIYTRICTNKY